MRFNMQREDPIDALSVVSRQCIAVTCLERFCALHRISHPALSEFVDHVWKVTQVEPASFPAWEMAFRASRSTLSETNGPQRHVP